MSTINFVKQSVTPSAPSTGGGKFYMKTDGGLYVMDDDGIETQATRVSGTLSEGGLVFGASGVALTVDADNLFWDNDNKRLGIGTASPTSRLHVQQAGAAKNVTDILTLTNTGNAADMDGTGTGVLFRQSYYDATTPVVADAGRIAIVAEQDWTSTASTRDAYMSFQLALDGTVSEKLRLTSGGNLGLGVTPSAWYYPAYSLANGSFYSRPDPSTGIVANAYSSTSGGGWKYISSAAASRYEQSAGAHMWAVAPSGTAGSAITFTQAMTLSASGDLLVGTTSGSTHTIQQNTNSELDALIVRSNAATTSNQYGLNVTLAGNPNNTANTFFRTFGNVTGISAHYSDGSWVIPAGKTYGNASDAKLKTSIVDATPKLADVCALRVRNYEAIAEPGSKYIGFIAQEFRDVFPALVVSYQDVDADGVKTGTETLGIKETALIPILVKAVQELKAENDVLKARLDADLLHNTADIAAIKSALAANGITLQ